MGAWRPKCFKGHVKRLECDFFENIPTKNRKSYLKNLHHQYSCQNLKVIYIQVLHELDWIESYTNLKPTWWFQPRSWKNISLVNLEHFPTDGWKWNIFEPRKKNSYCQLNPGCSMGILVMVYLFIAIPTCLGRISSPIYLKQPAFFHAHLRFHHPEPIPSRNKPALTLLYIPMMGALFQSSQHLQPSIGISDSPPLRCGVSFLELGAMFFDDLFFYTQLWRFQIWKRSFLSR